MVRKAKKRETKSGGKKKNAISDDKKKELARQVQRYPSLWNISDSSYMKRDANAACWDKVADAVDLSVDECKAQWKSLKDSLNYRLKTKKGKSGDSGPEEDGDAEEALDTELHLENSVQSWILWDDLKFLLENKPKRKTICTMDEDEIADGSDITEVSQETVNKNIESTVKAVDKKEENKKTSGNYYYMMSGKKRQRMEESKADDTQPLVQAITDMVQVRKDAIKPAVPNFGKYDAPLNNLNRLLLKVPDSVAEDLCMSFYQQAYTEVKKCEILPDI